MAEKYNQSQQEAIYALYANKYNVPTAAVPKPDALGAQVNTALPNDSGKPTGIQIETPKANGTRK